MHLIRKIGLGLTSMFNKDTPKHETRVSCVGRVSTRHGRLKSALQHAILVSLSACQLRVLFHVNIWGTSWSRVSN